MTESYDPYANVIAERDNGILKQEFLLEEINIDITEMKKYVKEAIDCYNGKRPHLSCMYKPPNQMHLQKSVKIKNYKPVTVI